MATKTARLYAADIDRAQVLAAVRGESPQEVLHAALNEYIDNHRGELDGAFRSVQAAVLSNDRETLGALFADDARRQATADSDRVARLLAESQD